MNVPYFRYLRLQEKLRKMRRELLLFLEHRPVITAGINYNMDELLVSEDFLKSSNIDLEFVKRGGKFTAHEPGQLVVYPHVDLKRRGLTISEYLDILNDSLQESVNRVWGVKIRQNRENPGLYLQERPEKKLISVGVDCKSWFSSFGAAINIHNTRETFSLIQPCGQKADIMISLSEICSGPLNENDFIAVFSEIFLGRLENPKKQR